MAGQSQNILDMGDNSVFIDADMAESTSKSLWLRIGQMSKNDARLVRLNARQARTLGFALLIHADALDDRLKTARSAGSSDDDTAVQFHDLAL